MKSTLPLSITDLLNGAALPPPVEPVRPIEIPTRGTDARADWKDAQRMERLARANRRAARDGRDIELPF